MVAYHIHITNIECVLRLIINVIIRTAVIGITFIQRSLIITSTVKATWRKSYYLLIYSPLFAGYC